MIEERLRGLLPRDARRRLGRLSRLRWVRKARIARSYGASLRRDPLTVLDFVLLDPEVDGAVLDVRMPPTFTDEGLRAAIAVRDRRPGFPAMGLSQYVEQLYDRERLASGAGAVGYLLKDRVSDVGEFVDGVRRVLAGGTVLDPEVVATVMARRRAEPPDRLPEREKEVLGLMAQGKSNARIGAALGWQTAQ